MVFCKGTKRNLSVLMDLIQEYGNASGQHLSLGKCKFFAPSMSAAKKQDIGSFLGFNVGSTIFSYLGVPIFQGKPRTRYLQPIADRIRAKLATWKGSMLSIMGRVQLVKSIIHGVLLYSFRVYYWPISFLKSLDRCIRNFIWSGDINKRKLVTVSWRNLCSSTKSDGLGLRSLRAINEASMLKLCWEMYSSDNQWTVLLRARFLRNNKLVGHYAKSSVWPSLRQFFNTDTGESLWLIGT